MWLFTYSSGESRRCVKQWKTLACFALYLQELVMSYLHTYLDFAEIVLVFSARQHICYSALYAIARPSVCLSVCPSVCHTGGSVKDGYS